MKNKTLQYLKNITKDIKKIQKTYIKNIKDILKIHQKTGLLETLIMIKQQRKFARKSTKMLPSTRW